MTKLVAAPIPKKSRAAKMSEDQKKNMIEASKGLARKILDTKKLYRKMTIEEQIDAMEYAYGIKVIFR